MNRTVYLVLFRGVGGKTQLPTKRSREALSRAGFEKVSTYINSGNAVLASSMPKSGTLKTIADICRRDFGFDKAIHLCTALEWRAVIDGNPFPHAAATPTSLHAAWLAAEPAAEKVAALRAIAGGGDAIEVVGRVAYLYTPEGFGCSKLAERFDKGIGVENTARNWNTVLKLGAMADAAEL